MLYTTKAYVNSALKSIKNPYFGLSFFMYFLSSVSMNIIAKTFNLYMQDAHYNQAYVVYIMNIITLPFAFKAFIIPLIDALNIPILSYLGKYKSLIIYFYTIVIISVFALSQISIVYIRTTTCICLIGFLFGICIDAMVSGYFNNISQEDRTWLKGGLIGYNFGTFLAIQGPLFFATTIHWQIIYKYIALILICTLPVIIMLPKCNPDEQTLDNTSKPNILLAYKAPFDELYTHYKSHFVWLLITLAFYRAPDRLLGYILTYIKREILGTYMYQIITLISSISIFISPLLFSEMKDTHFDRLIFINQIHTTAIILFGIIVMTWYKTHINILMYIMILLFIALKFIRLLESSIWFAYQCDLTTQTKYFQSQLAIFSSAEQGCAKAATFILYPLLNIIGNAYIFFIIGLTSLPAILALNQMKNKQSLLTKIRK